MKKINLILLMCVFCFFLGACSGNIGSINNEDKTASPTTIAQKVVEEAVDAIKDCDFKKISELTGADTSDFTGASQSYKKFIENVFSKLSYTINSAQMSGDSVIVQLSATVVDIPAVVTEAMRQIMTNKDILMGKTQEEIVDTILNAMTESAQKENLKTITDELEIPVTKKDNKWVPDFDTKDLNLLFGNVDKVINLFKVPGV